MLAAVLEEEVNVFLGRYRYARSQRIVGKEGKLVTRVTPEYHTCCWKLVDMDTTDRRGLAMRDMVFAMELRGRAASMEGSESNLRARTSGRGPAGETVNFESEVELSGETFNEFGSIDYTGRGTLKFQTVGTGHLGTSPLPETQWGAVIWRITEGQGEFQGASGYITSNFTVSGSGEVVDNQYVRMVLP